MTVEFKYPYGKLKERPEEITKLLRSRYPNVGAHGDWDFMLSTRYAIILLTINNPEMELWMTLAYSDYIIKR